MATAIKAIPTLDGKEAKEFLRRANESEKKVKRTHDHDKHPFCLMAQEILRNSGMI